VTRSDADHSSSATPELTVVVTRASRTADPAAFMAALRREVDRLGLSSEVIVGTPDPRGFGHELRQTLGRFGREPARFGVCVTASDWVC